MKLPPGQRFLSPLSPRLVNCGFLQRVCLAMWTLRTVLKQLWRLSNRHLDDHVRRIWPQKKALRTFGNGDDGNDNPGQRSLRRHLYIYVRIHSIITIISSTYHQHIIIIMVSISLVDISTVLPEVTNVHSNACRTLLITKNSLEPGEEAGCIRDVIDICLVNVDHPAVSK